MILSTILKFIEPCTPFTVGTEDGSRWVLYNDGSCAPIDLGIFSNRRVINIYPREARHSCEGCCDLKFGLAIIVEGNESGKI